MRIIPSEIGRKAADTLGRRQDLESSRAEFGIDPWTTFESCRRSSFYPPQFARLVVGGLPSAGEQCVVVGLGTAAENELRLIVRLVVHGTEPRHRDDDIAVLHHDGNVVRRGPKDNVPCVLNRTFSVSLLTNGQG